MRLSSDRMTSQGQNKKQRLLIFIVAYNAETTIEKVLYRLPNGLLDEYDVEVLIIDDQSKDQTFERGHAVRTKEDFPFRDMAAIKRSDFIMR